MEIHGKEYTPVNDRIKILFGKSDRTFPNAYIKTTVEWHNADFSAVVFKATVFPNDSDSDRRSFDGWALEERDSSSSQVNFSSWLENCETSAIGRALANMDIGTTKGRTSQEEMARPQRLQSAAPQLPQKKVIGKIAPVSGSAIAALEILSTEYKKVFGSDQFYQTILLDKKIEDVSKSTNQSLVEAVEALEEFLRYGRSILQGYKVNAVKELADDVREEVYEKLRKTSTLPF